MSKERLEEIEAKYSTLIASSERDGTEYTEVDVEDLVFLIQTCWNATESMTIDYESLTDRHVNITKEILEEYQEENEGLAQQNKRYREALEFYANKINYLTFIENGKSNIEHDQGEKARKALEGEE